MNGLFGSVMGSGLNIRILGLKRAMTEGSGVGVVSAASKGVTLAPLVLTDIEPLSVGNNYSRKE